MPFSQLTLQQLQQQRAAYAYPLVSLGGQLSNFNVVHFQSTCELDQYLTRLLYSENDEENVLGYLGVVFWGHYSGQDRRIRENRALGKVNLAYNGQDRVVRGIEQHMRGVLDIGISCTANKIKAATSYIANNQYTDALVNLLPLPQIQIAFASKICAFISPEKCGVIDSVIANRYPQLGFTLANGYVKNNTNNRNRYNQYCSCLQQVADKLNNDSSFSSWTDRDGSQNDWRAVDVERAVYL